MLKQFRFALLLVQITISFGSELLITDTNTTTKIEIPAGEVLALQVARIQDEGSYRFSVGNAYFTMNDDTNVIALQVRVPTVIAGPSELLLTNTPMIIVYDRLKSSNIFTRALDYTLETEVIVPEDTTFYMFSPLNQFESNVFARVNIAAKGKNVSQLAFRGGEKVPGPAVLRFRAGGIRPPGAAGASRFQLISYSLNSELDPVAFIPARSAGDQAVTITIEKSDDLERWNAVALQFLQAPRDAFFRLRIDR